MTVCILVAAPHMESDPPHRAHHQRVGERRLVSSWWRTSFYKCIILLLEQIVTATSWWLGSRESVALMVCKKSFAMATAPDCCFGRGVGLSPRASGKRASCHLVRQRATWSNGRGKRGGWLRRTGRSHCAACSVMWGTHRAKTLSLATVMTSS